MFNLFKKKKKQVQTDEEGFVFSEFPEDMFKKDKKKNKEVISKNPSEGWVCGTPDYMLYMSKKKENSKIPDEVMNEVDKELDEKFKDAEKYPGFEYKIWAEKRRLLEKRGYIWYSPNNLGEHTIFD